MWCKPCWHHNLRVMRLLVVKRVCCVRAHLMCTRPHTWCARFVNVSRWRNGALLKTGEWHCSNQPSWEGLSGVRWISTSKRDHNASVASCTLLVPRKCDQLLRDSVTKSETISLSRRVVTFGDANANGVALDARVMDWPYGLLWKCRYCSSGNQAHSQNCEKRLLAALASCSHELMHCIYLCNYIWIIKTV